MWRPAQAVRRCTGLTLFEVDGTPAGRGAAAAFHLFDIFPEVVIDRQFLALPNRFTGEIENVTLADLGDDIRVAAMIDVLRSTAANGAIEGPVVIECEEVDHAILLVTAAFGLFPADALTGVFHHLATHRNIFESVNTPPMYFGRPDFHFETGVSGIDRGFRSCGGGRR